MTNTEKKQYDCGIAVDNYWFRYRTGAIIIRDGKMLFVKSMFGGGYCYMIGGGVHLCEDSASCIEREVYEETGVKCSVVRPAIICENFFVGLDGKIDGKDCHVLEFYYLMTAPEDAEFRTKTDEGEELVWVPVDELEKYDIRPACVKENIPRVCAGEGLIHVINDEIRSCAGR